MNPAPMVKKTAPYLNKMCLLNTKRPRGKTFRKILKVELDAAFKRMDKFEQKWGVI